MQLSSLTLRSSLSAVALAVFSLAAQATVVDFEGLPAGAAANPLMLGGASFATPGGFNYVGPAFASAALCPSPSSASNGDCSLNLDVTFAAGASAISFTFAGNNFTTIGTDIGDVKIYSGATLLGTVDVIVLDTDARTDDWVNLSGFSDVTRLAISSTDIGGVVYDNFTFTVGAVPEPETYALMLAGLGLIGVAARRRKS